MALRLTVDYREASLVVNTDAVEPTTTFTYAKSSVTYQLMQALSAYELVALSDIYLDPDTLNKWFTVFQDSPDALTVTISEALAHSTSLSKADVATMSEAATLAFSISATDSYTVSESSAFSFGSIYTDSATMSEDLNFQVVGRLVNSATFNASVLN